MQSTFCILDGQCLLGKSRPLCKLGLTPIYQSVDMFLGKERQGASRNTWYLLPTPILQARALQPVPQPLLALLVCPSLVHTVRRPEISLITFLPLESWES